MDISPNIDTLLGEVTIDSVSQNLVSKILEGNRISPEEGVLLYEHFDLALLGVLANVVALRKNGGKVFFNRNFHIEPTNICIHNCTFCSYRREEGHENSWAMTLDDIKQRIQPYKNSLVTEVHITGGVHPKWDLGYYGKIIKTIKQELPDIHVKAFSAVEIDYILTKAKLKPREGIRKLKEYGLDSIPGGGAEIADTDIRGAICGTKTSWPRWLEIHEAAHLEGVSSNATMLYGHLENYRHRVEHMNSLRELQDKTGGFNCFIPLKFKASNNKLGRVGEVNTAEDLRNFAVARIFLDNINHLKAYWPMLGKSQAKLALGFGVDDLDGTIDESTVIYSMAGAEEQKPNMTVDEIVQLIKSTGKIPVERNSIYREVRSY
jgi:aminodeoxyfutalosine synthase